ncbi:hypothetical protein EC968_009667 [Mortierella alpina]|nr:hypothetical protein EC968_009667 [Mortierella alpina]
MHLRYLLISCVVLSFVAARPVDDNDNTVAASALDGAVAVDGVLDEPPLNGQQVPIIGELIKQFTSGLGLGDTDTPLLEGPLSAILLPLLPVLHFIPLEPVVSMVMDVLKSLNLPQVAAMPDDKLNNTVKDILKRATEGTN